MKLHSVVSYIVIVCCSHASLKGRWSSVNCHRGRYYPFCTILSSFILHTLAHGSILSIPFQVKCPYYPMHSYASWRGAMPFPAKAVQPTRRAQSKEPTSIIRVLCVCESSWPLLNSRHTQTRLTFPREEEEDRGEGPLSPESRILLNHAMGIYTDSRGLPWVDVGVRIPIRCKFFSRQSEKGCFQ
jgi:hypothetical protein